MNFDYRTTLEVLSAWAAILTAAIATFAYCKFLYERFERTKRLEAYLKDEKKIGVDQGQRTALHLMAALGMTESEIFSASFRTKKIKTVVSVDEQGRADLLLFEYCGEDIPAPRKF